MLLVRQVARPDAAVRQVARPEGALLCTVELLPDGAVLCAVELFPMVLCTVPGGSCFSMLHCGRMRVAMLLVRHVARPDGALLCAVELLPDGALRCPWR